MPNVGDVKQNVTVQSFQSFNGDNRTIAMYGVDIQAAKNITVFAGGGADTNFSGYTGAVFDLKGNLQIDANHSLQARIRTSHGAGKNTTQFRISPGVQEHIGKNTTLYINPYYAYKLDYDNSAKSNHSIGIFGGVTQKIGDKTSISVEVQRYNLQNPTDNRGQNWSANVILSYKF